MMKWISVKDFLPTLGQKVLGYGENCPVLGWGNKINIVWLEESYQENVERRKWMSDIWSEIGSEEIFEGISHWTTLPRVPND